MQVGEVARQSTDGELTTNLSNGEPYFGYTVKDVTAMPFPERVTTPIAVSVVVGEVPPSPARPRDIRPQLFSADVALRPWSNYSFRIAGRNGLGLGPFSRPTEHAACLTPAVKPFRNPTGVCANLTAFKGHLSVIWQVIESHLQYVRSKSKLMKRLKRDARTGRLVRIYKRFNFFMVIDVVNVTRGS